MLTGAFRVTARKINPPPTHTHTHTHTVCPSFESTDKRATTR